MTIDATAMVDAARALIDGRQGVIEATRVILRAGYSLGLDADDQDFVVFIGLDSETDHLPIGQQRAQWAANALESKDAEIQQSEDAWRQEAVEAAHRLVERFGRGA